MGRLHGYDSRTAWAAATSAAMDRADATDRLEREIAQLGWAVTRDVSGSEVAVELERPSGVPGLADYIRFAGLTALDAMREAHAWATAPESEGGEP